MKPRDNILLVGNWPSDTGYAWKMIERFWIAIADAFPDRRIILCFPKVTTVSAEVIRAGIEVKEFDFDFRRPAALAGFCRHHGIALVYLTDRPYSSATYPLLRFAGVRHIIVHDHTPGERTEPGVLKRIAKKASLKAFGADAYIACSEHVLERFTRIGCIAPEKCHLAQNGIDVTKFADPNLSIRDELALSPDTVIVVSCSRVNSYKRVTDIVDAAARLGDIDVHFIHIGDGPDFAVLQARIARHGLARRFTLLGAREDVPRILAGCDIGIHASNGEVGLSLSILEFMASRLAVLVTDEPSVSRVIALGRTGMTFPHGNVEAIARQLRLLAGDSAMRQRLGEAAREDVEVHYRIENTVSAVVEAITQTYLGRSSQPEQT